MSDLPTQDELTSLDGLIAQWDGFQSALAVAQEATKRLNAEITKLETDLIPALMASAGGIEKFKLEDGREVALRDELYASITEANRPGAFAWLEEHGHGDVIKDELKIMLGRGDTAKARAESLIAKAEAEGITDYSRKRVVAPNTLQALLKEQLAEGVEVPKETFGVFQQRRAIIKLPRK
mgnify:CR=1 FL=1